MFCQLLLIAEPHAIWVHAFLCALALPLSELFVTPLYRMPSRWLPYLPCAIPHFPAPSNTHELSCITPSGTIPCGFMGPSFKTLRMEAELPTFGALRQDLAELLGCRPPPTREGPHPGHCEHEQWTDDGEASMRREGERVMNPQLILWMVIRAGVRRGANHSFPVEQRPFKCTPQPGGVRQRCIPAD